MNRRDTSRDPWASSRVKINYSGSFDVRLRIDGHAKPEMNNWHER
jgi:hypothetical protein